MKSFKFNAQERNLSSKDKEDKNHLFYSPYGVLEKYGFNTILNWILNEIECFVLAVINGLANGFLISELQGFIFSFDFAMDYYVDFVDDGDFGFTYEHVFGIVILNA